jgi:hypothetical protein
MIEAAIALPPLQKSAENWDRESGSFKCDDTVVTTSSTTTVKKRNISNKMADGKPYSTLDEFFTDQKRMLFYFERNRALVIHMVRDNVQNSENWTDDEIIRELVHEVRMLEAEQRQAQEAQTRRAQEATFSAPTAVRGHPTEAPVPPSNAVLVARIPGDGTSTAFRTQDDISMGGSVKTFKSLSSMADSVSATFFDAPGDEMGGATGIPRNNVAPSPDRRAVPRVAALPASSDGSSVQNFEPFPVAFGSPADHVEEEDDSMKHEEDEQQELDRKPSAK